MTIEDKELVLKDLSARLLTNVVIHTDLGDLKLDKKHRNIGVLYYEDYSEDAKKRCNYDTEDFSIIISGCYYGDIKPYLRSMSSMTEEEEKEYWKIDNRSYSCPMSYAHVPSSERIDWLIKHHFDYRGLIEKGLAIEAPMDMYV